MASYDPSLSNGTCYYNYRDVAIQSYIPCGNAAGGFQSCCQARDICLSSHACYNGQFGVTYLAGCTDPDYQDSACPYKGLYEEQQWVGLVRCYVSNATDEQNEEWAPCEDQNSQPTLAKGEACTCTEGDTTPVFTDAPVLTNIASLPVTTGDHISWFPGFTPLTTVSVTTSRSSVPSSVFLTKQQNSTATMSATSPELSSMSASDTQGTANLAQATTAALSSQGLSTGAKIGLGVGLGGGLIIVCCLVGIFVFMRLQKRKEKDQDDYPPVQGQTRPFSEANMDEKVTNTVYRDSSTITTINDTELRSPAWSGHKSELPAEESIAPTSPTLSSPNEQYQAYNPAFDRQQQRPQRAGPVVPRGMDEHHRINRSDPGWMYHMSLLEENQNRRAVHELPA